MLASSSSNGASQTTISSSKQQHHSSSQQQQTTTTATISSQTYKIITQYGDMLVVRQGIQNAHHLHHHHHNQSSSHSSSQSAAASGGSEQQHQSRPVIMTFHDLGLNSELQFASFCDSDEVKLMLQTFTMIHVNFIGQEFRQQPTTGNTNTNTNTNHSNNSHSCCSNLPPDFKYPSVEQMAECIVDVCAQLRVRSFIALAVGAGAHIVSSLALMRPDLVDGLFLINPVVTSCSITEWLYFKMSAIASNHGISGGHSAERLAGSNSEHSPARAKSSLAGSTTGGSSCGSSTGRGSPTRAAAHAHQQQQSPGGSSSAAAVSGLRKLLKAAHIHLPHHSSSQNHHSPQVQSQHIEQSARVSGELGAEEPASGPEGATGELGDAGQQQEDAQSIGQVSCQSSGSLASSSNQQPTGSRLRRLILSRNFRLAGGAGGSGHLNRADSVLSARESPTGSDIHQQAAAAAMTSGAADHRKASRGSNESGESGRGGSHSSSPGGGGKRAPYEYLMYHHFGPSSFQRYRRSSDTLAELNSETAAAAASGSRTEKESPLRGSVCSSSAAAQSKSQDSLVAAAQSAATGQRQVDSSGEQQAAGELQATGGGSRRAASAGRARSGSLCLSSSYLASFSSCRQRNAYMQSVYKHYFSQLNAHNLWLFAQSFAKRRTLNLRKDCGAAAHAAAAAAALGTSICTAFVGADAAAAAASASGPAQRSGRPEGRAPGPTSAAGSLQSASDRRQQQQQQQALVAGTKVKRTFTCQTLIMCSSVQMHCERAFKLMSLLNPLQATWIKTDHLLVLEERPEKVCQALRLFLQGIGYSMSTYERRLRLSSAAGSASSADSSGSLRSLSADRTN